MRSGVPFGRYSLVRRLARGGMAEIFLALQEGPEGFSRRLVIKRILPHLAADPAFLRMFMDEARIVAMLSHPHIVHLYDFGQVDGSYYLAMEYVDGIDLKALGDRAGPVSPEHAAKIMSYVCEGLSHAHDLSVEGRRLGLVHRDVTPSNILISFDGSVKVADFGIAKTYSGDEKTKVGVVKGKFAYLSPEQARGMSLDHRSDQFNIGILLYELLTGTTLFPHDSFQRAMRAIVGGGIDPPEMIQPGVPLGLSRIVMKALEPDRERRYPDTLALRADLESFLREYPDPSDAVLIGRYIRELFPEHGPVSAAATGPLPQGTAPMARPQTRPVAGEENVASEAPGGLPPLLLAKTRKERSLSSSDGEPVAVEPMGTAPAGQPADLHDAPTSLHAELLDERDLIADDSTDAAVTTMVTTGGTEVARGSIYESAWERGRRRRRRRSITIGLAVALVASGLTAGGLLWTGGAPADPGSEPPPKPPRMRLLPPPRQAQVRLSSRPAGAVITLDGAPTSITTPAILDVEGGVDHTILVALSGFQEAERHVVPAAGGTLEVDLVLEPLAAPPLPPPEEPGAVLEIETRPSGARVEVDGALRDGQTPMTIFDLEPGPHVLRLAADGHEPLERRIELEPGESETLELRLRRLRRGGTSGANATEATEYGTLTINTIPWSKVYLGGRLLGMTPLANVRVPAGRHVIRMVNPDRPERTTVVVIQADQNKRVQLSL
ncbi:MAG: serine/threonine protein kinase [Deltaproteobacteria bacterium]|nr:serine/threonine protein kinase [Deltaproteobacteria bacterium]